MESWQLCRENAAAVGSVPIPRGGAAAPKRGLGTPPSAAVFTPLIWLRALNIRMNDEGCDTGTVNDDKCSVPGLTQRLCNATEAKSLKEEGFDSYLQAGHIADRPLLVVCGLLLFPEGPPMSAWRWTRPTCFGSGRMRRQRN